VFPIRFGRVGQVAAALTVLAAVASCSSSSGSSSTAPPTTSNSPHLATGNGSSTPAGAPSSGVSSSPAGTQACATSALSVTLGPSEGSAGAVEQTIVFTNTSGATCTLYGYPGVSLVSAQPYTQIGAAAQRSSTVPVKLITLAAGAAANAVVQIADAQNFPTASCGPTQAAFLRVYPPNQTAPVYLADSAEGCSEPVQTLTITAVQAGSTSNS
jgi:hypothetical protein